MFTSYPAMTPSTVCGSGILVEVLDEASGLASTSLNFANGPPGYVNCLNFFEVKTYTFKIRVNGLIK
jgi:hypothetical protein